MSRTFRNIPHYMRPRSTISTRRDRNVQGFDGLKTDSVSWPNASAPNGHDGNIGSVSISARHWAKRKAHHIARRRGKKGIAQDLVQFYLDAWDDQRETEFEEQEAALCDVFWYEYQYEELERQHYEELERYQDEEMSRYYEKYSTGYDVYDYRYEDERVLRMHGLL